MDTAEFSDWLSAIGRLSGEQISLALAELADFARRSGGVRKQPSAEARHEAEPPSGKGEGRKGSRIERDVLATIGEGKVERLGCAHCGADEIVGWGRSHGLPRYRCKACGRTFNAATGTAMARLRKKDRWLDPAQAMIDGVSLAKAAERCGVHPTTAYRWRHRFLSAPALDKPQMLQGIVEADETFMLESFKGRRSGLVRKARKRGGVCSDIGQKDRSGPAPHKGQQKSWLTVLRFRRSGWGSFRRGWALRFSVGYRGCIYHRHGFPK